MSSWYTKLDPNSQAALRRKVEQDALLSQRPVTQDPQVAERMSVINQRAPWLTPQQTVALAKSYATDGAIDEAGRLQGHDVVAQKQQNDPLMAGVARVAQMGISSLALAARMTGKAIDVIPGALDAVTTAGSWLHDHVVDPMKPYTRVGFAVLDAVPETIMNTASLLVGTKAKNKSLGGFWDSLSIATLLDEPNLQGEGFFVGDEFRAEQARRARDFRGELNGSAFTVGRGAANVFFIPNSQPYNYMSGFIDAMVNVLAPDPTKLLSKGVRAVTAIEELPLLAKADVGVIRAALKAEGGLADNLAAGSIDLIKWNKMLDENPVGRALIDDIAKNDNELAIMEEIFNYDISPDLAVSLAKAKTRDEVKAALAEGYVPGEGTLSTNIYNYRNPAQTVVERAPLVNTLRKSRWFRDVPEQLVVINGTRFDRTKAVRNMINSARGAGATEDEIAELSKKIIPAFRAGSTADDQYDAYGAYEQTIKLILKKNGVPDQVVKRVLEKPKGSIDKLRAYMLDRSGMETDHGALKTFVEMMKEDLPPEFYTDFLEKAGHLGDEVGFGRPMQIVELLNRMQTLPDPRELRRLTRNSFFAEMLKTEGEGLVPRKGGPLGLLSTSKREEFKVITNEKKYKEISDEIEKLATAPDAAKSREVQSKITSLEKQRDALVTEKKFATGEQKVIYDLLDVIQNAFWKPLALATGGYAIRNSIDAQIRMHFGADTGIYHPFQYLGLLSKKVARKSILGENITAEDFDVLRKEHKDFLAGALRNQNLDTAYVAEHLRKTNSWRGVTRADGIDLHTDGIIQQGRLAFRDPLQSVAARGLALGKSEDEIVEMVLKFAREKDNYDEIKGIFKRGATYKNIDGYSIQAPSIDFDKLSKKRVDDYLRAHIKSVVLGNVKNNTGNLDPMLYMFGWNKVPKLEETVVRNRLEVVPLATKEVTEGALVKFDMGEGIVARMSGDNVSVIPVHSSNAFDAMEGSSEARKLVGRQPLFNEQTGQGLPQSVAREIMMRNKRDSGWLASFEDAMNVGTNWFFTELYNDKYVARLEKNPVFRKLYYDNISKNIGRLDGESAKQLLSRLRAGAKSENMSVASYIGDRKVAARIEEIAKAGTKGTATAEELDDYARFMALQQAKKLLYDASDRKNIEDIMRVMMPFAGAWRDIIGSYMGTVATQNVRAIRSFQRVYAGAKYADPDNDGRGFFYKDPQNDKLMFAFPFSGAIASLVQNVVPGGGPTVKTILEAPVKQLSQGINVFPALGPMAQIGASAILPDVPKFNTITELLLPYGKKKMFNPLPGWLQKATEILQADTTNTTTAYFNTYTEVMRAKAASGQYDLSREDEKERLLSDSKWDARWLTGLRMLSQFVGPTSGTTEFKVDTKQGDIFVGELIKEFRKMQEDDYDTAVPRFLDLYGENVGAYVASKSKSILNGLEVSEEFGNWTIQNEELLNKYPDVAAYFAPKGSDFNFAVWRRQLDKGYRKNLTAEEILDAAQERIGAAKYSQARRMFGAYPSGRQRDILSIYREQLHQQYPGFPRYPEFVANKFENSIANLEELITNPRVQSSQTTSPLSDYLAKRRDILGALGKSTLRSRAASNARGYLYRYGEELARMYPEFDRIWGRLLVQEVDQ